MWGIMPNVFMYGFVAWTQGTIQVAVLSFNFYQKPSFHQHTFVKLAHP